MLRWWLVWTTYSLELEAAQWNSDRGSLHGSGPSIIQWKLRRWPAQWRASIIRTIRLSRFAYVLYQSRITKLLIIAVNTKVYRTETDWSTRQAQQSTPVHLQRVNFVLLTFYFPTIHHVRKKGATWFFAVTLPNPNRSSKFFYHHTQQ